jgi:hypothetical protein
VRAVAACPVPVVSAVGHELDTPLCDLAADVRAATPTAAARLVVPDAAELRRSLEHARARIRDRARGQVDRGRDRSGALRARSSGASTASGREPAVRASAWPRHPACSWSGVVPPSTRPARASPRSPRSRRSSAATPSSGPGAPPCGTPLPWPWATVSRSSSRPAGSPPPSTR